MFRGGSEFRFRGTVPPEKSLKCSIRFIEKKKQFTHTNVHICILYFHHFDAVQNKLIIIYKLWATFSCTTIYFHSVKHELLICTA